MQRLSLWLCSLVVLTPLAGCGGSGDRVELGQVTGTVTYNGQPLPHGHVAFHPEKGRSASAEIKDGAIVDATTYEQGDGVPLGNLKVTVTAVDNPEADMYTKTKSIIPQRYADPAKSGLSVEIKPGANTVTLELKD